jgi:soluble lytic murein transglycosylase
MKDELRRSKSRRPFGFLQAFALLAIVPFASATASVEKARGNPAPAGLSTAIDPLSFQYPQNLQAALSAAGRGIDNFVKGRYDTALAALPDESSAGTTAVADYIMLYRAKACLELGRGREALGIFRQLQERFPDSALMDQCLAGQARALLLLQDPAGALATLNQSRVRETAENLSLRAQASQAQGNLAEAIALYLRIFADHAGSSEAAAAEKQLRALSPSFVTMTGNRGSILRRAENLIRAGGSSDARGLLLRIACNAGPQAEKLALLIADADTNLRFFDEALRYLSRVNDTALAAQATYLQGVSYRGLGKEAAFLAARDRALQLYPESPFTEKLLYSVATYFEVDNRAAQAREAYQALAAAFPKGEYAERALWKAGMFFYVEKQYLEALNAFWRCLLANSKPGAAGAPVYWMARCFEKLGDNDKASYLYGRIQILANHSYYGQRARDAAGAVQSNGPSNPLHPAAFDFNKTLQLMESIRPGTAAFPQASVAALRMIERARQLAAAGLLDLSLSELAGGYAEGAAREMALSYASSRIYQAKNNFLGAITTLRRAFPEYIDLPPESLPEEIWSILFPLRYLTIVTRHAAWHDIDPDLVLALIRQESAFQESARSKADARGLMQILPATGRMLARQAGMQSYATGKLYTAETNVALGTRHLSALLRRYGGKVELALAAYNAGESRVDRWLQEFGDVDLPEFVERIPFSETRSYIKTVLSCRAHYHLHTMSNAGPAGARRTD